MNLAQSIRDCTAQIVVASAINEGLTHMKQQVFDANAEAWTEDRVAREFGADALDHFRAIRKRRDALIAIIKMESSTDA